MNKNKNEVKNMKKLWNVKLTLIVDREYAEEMTKNEAKEMALDDFYDDMRHSCFQEPKIEIKEVKIKTKKRN